MQPAIVRATSDHLEVLTPLFDAYRMFYGSDSDVAGARRFLEDRFAQSDLNRPFDKRLTTGRMHYSMFDPLKADKPLKAES